MRRFLKEQVRTRWVVELSNNVLVPGGIPTVLIGNKADLEREVSTEDGRALAEELQWSFFETSAKTGALVDEALDNIVASQFCPCLKIFSPYCRDFPCKPAAPTRRSRQ